MEEGLETVPFVFWETDAGAEIKKASDSISRRLIDCSAKREDGATTVFIRQCFERTFCFIEFQCILSNVPFLNIYHLIPQTKGLLISFQLRSVAENRVYTKERGTGPIPTVDNKMQCHINRTTP